MTGVRWHLKRTVAPDTTSVFSLAFVRDDHLRGVNGSAEDEYILGLIEAAYNRAERVTRRALAPQTWQMVLDRFPAGSCPIRIPKAPVIEVTSIEYVDEDGATQNMNGSPAEYQTEIPAGPKAGYALIHPNYDETWPTTRLVPNAVTVTFRAGYSDGGSPEAHAIPQDILHGMLLVIGEFYKQRSESVHAFNQNPALIRARDIWMDYRSY